MSDTPRPRQRSKMGKELYMMGLQMTWALVLHIMFYNK